jgi:acetoin utilization deacetylase AcuC-like enzyme
MDLPDHPWIIGKYKTLYETVLVKELARKEDIIFVNEASEEDLSLVHTWSYLKKFVEEDWGCEEFASSELPMDWKLARFFYTNAEGTIIACREALISGRAVHIGGGHHHAFPGFASGFCPINDIAVGIRKTQKDKRVSRALVVDLDVHQGDGTAKIFEKDSSVFTFSMHQKNNFPYRKQKSNLDVELKDKTGDEEYLSCLEKHLPGIIRDHKPELIVYVAGADSYEGDLLGGLSLSMDGLKRRDEFVVEQATKFKIPIVATLAGGYAKQPDETVQIHLTTIKTFISS